MRNLATSYKNLSATEREKYNKKAKLAFDEYNRMKMEYMWVTTQLKFGATWEINTFVCRAVKDPENLKSPYFLFCEYWKQKDGKLNATQLKNKYDDMSQNDKYKWVEKAVKANPGVSYYIDWYIQSFFTHFILMATDKYHEFLEQRWAETVSGTSKVGGHTI